MKNFIDEFGYAILAACVIAIMIWMASPLGEQTRNYIKKVAGGKASEQSEVINEMGNSDIRAIGEQDSEGNITLTYYIKKEGSYLVEYSVKHDGVWGEWSGFEVLESDSDELLKGTLEIQREDIRRWSLDSKDFIKFRLSSGLKGFETDIFPVNTEEW